MSNLEYYIYPFRWFDVFTSLEEQSSVHSSTKFIFAGSNLNKMFHRLDSFRRLSGGFSSLRMYLWMSPVFAYVFTWRKFLKWLNESHSLHKRVFYKVMYISA